MRDTSRKERAEQQLRRLIGILESTTDLVATANMEGLVTYLNPAGRRLLGLGEKEALEGMRIRDAHPQWAYDLISRFGIPSACREGVWTGEVAVLHRDGHEIPVSQVIAAHRSSAGEVDLISTIMRDISTAKRYEEALKKREEEIRSIFRAAPTGIGMVVNRVIREANARLCEMTGYAREELLGQNARLLYAGEEEFERVGRDKYGQIRERGTGTVETQWVRKDGALIEVLLSSSPIDQTDLSSGVTFTALDITERKRAEVERRLSAARLSALMELAGMSDEPLHRLTDFALEKAVELTGSRIGYLAFMNETETVLTMYSWSSTAMAECLMGDKPLVYPVEKTGLWGEAVRQRRPVITNDFASPNPWKRGYPAGHVAVNRHLNIPLFDGGRIVLVSGVGNKGDPYDETDVRQLTLLMDGMWKIIKRKRADEEKGRLEEQLRQAVKMEAVGRLAGGVAHDFNNLLTAILGYADMALHRLPGGDPVRTDLEEIARAAEHAATLTRQLLAFSRKQIIEPKVLDLNELLVSSQKMLARLIGEDIALAFYPDRNLDRVRADPAQIEQVLVNLVVNARDAMPGGGRLTVETSNVVIDEEYARAQIEVQPGRYVMIAVSDTGTGMEEEVRARVFEPFFTTKEKGRGTGLGLSTVYGVVKQNGGFVQVYSEPGQGTTFKVYLPPAPGEAEARPVHDHAGSPRGTEAILLVEDERLVRELVRRILEEHGYRVLEAADGDAALRLAEREGDGIDLLLTDVIMPKMNGRELYRQLLSVRPGLRALFISGYSENVVAQQEILDRGSPLLHKPFTIAELARRVREVLDRH